MKNIALFASSNGSTFEYILNKTQASDSIKTKLLISNKKNCGAVKKAVKHDCFYKIINPKNYSNLQLWDQEVLSTLKPLNIDLIVLAGYLQKIGGGIIQNYKLINTHPSLLPKYGGKGMFGKHIHNKVFANKDEFTGATVHYVSKNYDEGQIIKQIKIPLQATQNASQIEELVKAKEKPLLWEVITELLSK